jgi:arylsulfatase A-like enzyme
VGSKRPNLILILTDHWRGDSLGRLGHPAAETPHLDGLAAEGVTFTNAFSPCPSCIAARRSLMTGLTPASHGMLGYQDGQPWPYTETLAGTLQRAGYQTINVGKTHFHPPRLRLGFEELVLPQDYDEWLDATTGLLRSRFAHGVHGNSWMARPSHLPETQMEETWLTDQAMRRLRKRDPTRPFFLCLSFNGPHPPWCPPQVYYDRFDRQEMPPPVVGEWAALPEATRAPNVNTWRAALSPERLRRARVGYYAYLAYIDAQIGRFLEFLGRSGLGRSYIAFTADHGEMLGDHHLWRKTFAYDPSARIPLLLKAPPGSDLPADVDRSAPVGLEDLMPTFLEAAGVPVPAGAEGRSLLPLWRDRAAPAREYYHHEHSSCYAEENAYQCLTSRDWKYIWNPVTGAEQLFDRTGDPYELCDLAPDRSHAEELHGWRRRLARKLQGRPEGLSDGESLRPGRVPVWRDPRGADGTAAP